MNGLLASLALIGGFIGFLAFLLLLGWFTHCSLSRLGLDS